MFYLVIITLALIVALNIHDRKSARKGGWQSDGYRMKRFYRNAWQYREMTDDEAKIENSLDAW